MSIKHFWQEIKTTVLRGQRSNMHCSIATVDEHLMPNITPIGSVFLHDEQSGFFFDTYTIQLSRNLVDNSNICLMAVNSSLKFWLTSFIKGKFDSAPGVRLYGKAGPLRAATDKEIELIHQRIKPLRHLKGSKMLWSDFTHVRDMDFTDFRPVEYPKMMEHLWVEKPC